LSGGSPIRWGMASGSKKIKKKKKIEGGVEKRKTIELTGSRGGTIHSTNWTTIGAKKQQERKENVVDAGHMYYWWKVFLNRQQIVGGKEKIRKGIYSLTVTAINQ